MSAAPPLYDDDDLPPPLEDMTEELARLKATNTPADAFPLGAPAPRKAPSEGAKPGAAAAKPPPARKAAAANPKAKKAAGGGSMFGGMAGGFLGGGKPRPRKKKAVPAKAKAASAGAEDVLRPGKPEQSPLVFEEVQKKVFGEFESQEKLTNELIGEVSKEDRLMERMKDPRIARAVAEISADPNVAMTKYANDTEVNEVFRDFMKVAGRRAERQAKEEEASQQKAREEASKPREVAPEQMQRWLADPMLRAVLNDPWTGHALSEIQRDSNLFAKYAGDRRLQALVRAGILQVPPQFRLQ